jgi:hypothetical protein
MVDSVTGLYPHRKKMDGSTDVLCLNCLATIAMEQEEGGYAPHHVCSPWLVAKREIPGRGRAA